MNKMFTNMDPPKNSPPEAGKPHDASIPPCEHTKANRLTRSYAFPDVIHGRGKKASKKLASSPPSVNNSASALDAHPRTREVRPNSACRHNGLGQCDDPRDEPWTEALENQASSKAVHKSGRVPGSSGMQSQRAKKGKSMNTNAQEQMKWYVGWDWAKAKHQISVLDVSGQEVEKWEAAHTAEGLRQAVERLVKRKAIGEVLVAIETPHGLFVEALLEAGITLYVVHPKVSKRLREALAGESKNDEREAWALGEALRLHHPRWKPLVREDDLTRRLQLLTRDEQGFIAQVTQLSNRLQHALGQYYPQAQELFDDWTSPSGWDFILQFPTPQAFEAASWRKLQNFLHVHRLAKPERLEAWKKIHERVTPWPMSAVLSAGKQRQAQLLARELQLIQRGLQEYRKEIEALWKEHPDQPIFSSFTGLGKRLGPRILSELGTDRSAFPEANSIQCYGGVVPRQQQSGDTSVARCRKGANHTLQHNLFLWAKVSVVWCPWAHAFYKHEIKRGKWSADTYRRLAAKWTRIFWKCWTERKPYDEAQWMESLKRRGSWLFEATMRLSGKPLEPMEVPL